MGIYIWDHIFNFVLMKDCRNRNSRCCKVFGDAESEYSMGLYNWDNNLTHFDLILGQNIDLMAAILLVFFFLEFF